LVLLKTKTAFPSNVSSKTTGKECAYSYIATVWGLKHIYCHVPMLRFYLPGQPFSTITEFLTYYVEIKMEEN
jgi:hypothetical protein